jgi:hypothetical protein
MPSRTVRWGARPPAPRAGSVNAARDSAHRTEPRAAHFVVAKGDGEMGEHGEYGSAFTPVTFCPEN